MPINNIQPQTNKNSILIIDVEEIFFKESQ